MSSAQYPKLSYTSYVLGVLMVLFFLSTMDRQIPNFLVGPIRHSFDISDTKMSLIQGSSFAILFSILGLPLGSLVDRVSRRNIICCGLAVWSLMTVYCGLASDFWHLFIGRMGVGIGEAALAPAVYSLIADYVEPRKRGRALSIYFLAGSLSSGLSLVFIGYLLGLGGKLAQSLPLFHDREPWQIGFIIAGVPGLIAVPFVLLIREVPRRANSGGLVEQTDPKSRFQEFFRHMGANRRVFISVYGSFVFLQFGLMAAYAWAPSFYVRKFGMAPGSLGFILGFLLAGVGFSGTALGGLITDRFAARNRRGGRLLIPCLACAAIVIPHLLWPMVSNRVLSFVLFGLAMGGTSLAYSTAPAIVQDIVPNRMRGKAVAVYMLLTGLSGYALGPTAVAMLTDHVFKSDAALPYSLIICLAPAALIASILAWVGLRPYLNLRMSLIGSLTASESANEPQRISATC